MWKDSERILKRMDLRGKYQRKNLRTVLAAVDILKNIPAFKGLEDCAKVADAIERTAERMDFHGRWERLSYHPFVIADIGHNPAALKENFAQLQSMLDEGECSSLIIIYAVMADKDLDGIMPLMPENAAYIFTTRKSAAHCRRRSWRPATANSATGTAGAATGSTKPPPSRRRFQWHSTSARCREPRMAPDLSSTLAEAPTWCPKL
jgi:Folylpolyglutamate synthase